MANSVDPDQIAASGAVWSGFTLFVYAILLETKFYRNSSVDLDQTHFLASDLGLHYLSITLFAWWGLQTKMD